MNKRIACSCRFKFGNRKCNVNKKLPNFICQCKFKSPIKYRVCREDPVGNLVNMLVR